jgi:hypothetical protein
MLYCNPLRSSSVVLIPTSRPRLNAMTSNRCGMEKIRLSVIFGGISLHSNVFEGIERVDARSMSTVLVFKFLNTMSTINMPASLRHRVILISRQVRYWSFLGFRTFRGVPMYERRCSSVVTTICRRCLTPGFGMLCVTWQ